MKPPIDYKCVDCGETNKDLFYQRRKIKCKSCFNKDLLKKWKQNKVKAVELKGGKCSVCGYYKSMSALEFHHIDPTTKEENWNRMRTLSWNNILSMLEGTVLLCSNCHCEEHDKIRNKI
jgi:DNA-directed RNA polymerase subunit RPC12/RpoP